MLPYFYNSFDACTSCTTRLAPLATSALPPRPTLPNNLVNSNLEDAFQHQVFLQSQSRKKCPRCTMLNSAAATKISVCNMLFEQQEQAERQQEQTDEEKQWPLCTFLNPAETESCDAYGLSLATITPVREQKQCQVCTLLNDATLDNCSACDSTLVPDELEYAHDNGDDGDDRDNRDNQDDGDDQDDGAIDGSSSDGLHREEPDYGTDDDFISHDEEDMDSDD